MTRLLALFLCLFFALEAFAGETAGEQAAAPVTEPVSEPAANLPLEDEPEDFLDEARRYTGCLKLARKNPRKAFDNAIVWTNEEETGKEFPARHCLAASLLAMQNFSAAALLLEELIDEIDDPTHPLKAELLRQAGQAWMLDYQPEEAEEKFTAALVILPDDPDLFIDRSIAKAERQEYWQALDDLNRAIELAPDQVEPLILRSTTYRHLNGIDLARDDIDLALKLSPNNPDALFERGMIRYMQEDTKGAREDWQSVLLFAPRSPLAQAAKKNLEKVSKDQAPK